MTNKGSDLITKREPKKFVGKVENIFFWNEV